MVRCRAQMRERECQLAFLLFHLNWQNLPAASTSMLLLQLLLLLLLLLLLRALACLRHARLCTARSEVRRCLGCGLVHYLLQPGALLGPAWCTTCSSVVHLF